MVTVIQISYEAARSAGRYWTKRPSMLGAIAVVYVGASQGQRCASHDATVPATT